MVNRALGGGVVMVLLGAIVGGGCLGAEPNAGSQCELFGGTCTTESLCQGSLPYGCGTGVCCESALSPPPDATASAGDATTHPGADATMPSTHDSGHDATTPDAPAPREVDTGISPADTGGGADSGGGEASAVADAAGMDTGTPPVDAGSHEDAHEDDAHAEDAHEEASKPKDAGTKDAGAKDAGTKEAGRDLDAGFTCNGYASPNEPENVCEVTMCPGTVGCQKNGCFNGDYCHLSTGRCVHMSSVTCDGGL